jgi:hypothetical protein
MRRFPRPKNMNATPTLADLQNEATWLEWRDQIIAPQHSTGLVTTDQSRAEFLEGARLLRLDKRRRYDGKIIGPTPIQLAIADTLAAGQKLNAFLEPRRSTKTTSIQAVLLGRCSLRDDYLVGWTMATTGAKTGERFRKDIVQPLERLYPDDHSRPFKLYQGKGDQAVSWPNGSWFNIYSPNGDGFRSGAFDVAWVDEAGEAEPELGEDLTASIRPTLHTRHGAQLILSGTAATYRAGNLLWDGLTDPSAAVLRHGIPDDTDPELLNDWATVEPLVLASHPGIGWSTPLDAIHDDWNTPAMRKSFAAEILGLFGEEGSNVALIPQPLWTASAVPLVSVKPGTLSSLAAVVHPDGSAASVVQAWTGADGYVYGALIHHQAGVVGFRKKLLLLSRQLGRPITYDSKSTATEVEMRQLREARPAPAERPLLTADISRSAVHLLNLIREDKFRHFDQAELNGAAEIAIKRPIGQTGGWGFGRPDVKRRPGDDITPLEALSLAIWALQDERKLPETPQIDFFDAA